MITLYGAGEGFGLPEISPFVTKTEAQLKMAGVPYQKARALPDQAPKGQLPFITVGGITVADSTFIRDWLERTYEIDLDETLSARERAEAWAVERMLENHFAWAMLHGRWLIPGNFERGPARLFDEAPLAIRGTIRRDALERVRATIHVTGLGRHTEPEVVALGVRSLEALSMILCDKPWLYGERPCGADATAFAFLAAILTPHFESELRRQAEGFPDLVAYADRLMATFYPDFAWRVAQPEECVAA